MRCLVMNGNPKASAFDDYLAGFGQGLQKEGHAVRRVDLRDLRLEPCTGCWTCWWKTPGLCARKDGMAGVYPEMAAADLVVWASPLVLGTVSSLTKMAQDRFVPMAHPYIELVAGECHHRHRYAHNADIGLIVAPSAEDTDEDLAIVHGLYQRFSRNTRTRLRLFVTTRIPSEEAAREALAA
jgi:multimeric flavodoxin WrbA